MRRSRRSPLLFIGLNLVLIGYVVTSCATPRIAPGPALSKVQGMNSYLQPTNVINSDDPLIRDAVAKLTSDEMSDVQKAVRIHDFVRDQILFGWQGAFYEVRASEVLEAGVGYCNTKSTLFVALLRAAKIPARQHCVDVDARILSGLIDPGTPYVDHSFTEVHLDGSWIRTDSYIVDTNLARAARKRLKTEGRKIGYGVHLEGSTDWDGKQDSFSQFVNDERDFTTLDHGVHQDVMTFYRDAQSTWNKLSPWMRPLVRFGVGRGTRAAAKLRESAD